MSQEISFTRPCQVTWEGTTTVHLDRAIRGINYITVTRTFKSGYWQFKGWGMPDHIPLNGSILDGKLFRLFKIDKNDPDLAPPQNQTALRAFVAYRHTGEDPAELRPMLTSVCEALREQGIDVYCTFFSEEEFQSKSLGPRAIMEHAFSEIDARDILIIIQASNSKSEGMLLEAGYCLGTDKPFVVAIKSGVENTYLPDLATYSFIWTNSDDLRRQIEVIDFASLVESAEKLNAEQELAWRSLR